MIRQSHNYVMFIMGITILVRQSFYMFLCLTIPILAAYLPVPPVIPGASQTTLVQLLLAVAWGHLVSQANKLVAASVHFVVLWFSFHCSLLLRIQTTISKHLFRYRAGNKPLPDPVMYFTCIYVSPCFSSLKCIRWWDICRHNGK